MRLASKLIGWDIDIKSEEEAPRDRRADDRADGADHSADRLAGVGPKTSKRSKLPGSRNVEKLAGMTPEQLMEIPGIGEKMVDKIYQAVDVSMKAGQAVVGPRRRTLKPRSDEGRM